MATLPRKNTSPSASFTDLLKMVKEFAFDEVDALVDKFQHRVLKKTPSIAGKGNRSTRSPPIHITTATSESVSQFLSQKNEKGVTCVMLAAECRSVQPLRSILRWGADPGGVDAGGKNSLHYACHGGSLKCFLLILRAIKEVRLQINDAGVLVPLLGIKPDHEWKPIVHKMLFAKDRKGRICFDFIWRRDDWQEDFEYRGNQYDTVDRTKHHINPDELFFALIWILKKEDLTLPYRVEKLLEERKLNYRPEMGSKAYAKLLGNWQLSLVTHNDALDYKYEALVNKNLLDPALFSSPTADETSDNNPASHSVNVRKRFASDLEALSPSPKRTRSTPSTARMGARPGDVVDASDVAAPSASCAVDGTRERTHLASRLDNEADRQRGIDSSKDIFLTCLSEKILKNGGSEIEISEIAKIPPSNMPLRDKREIIAHDRHFEIYMKAVKNSNKEFVTLVPSPHAFSDSNCVTPRKSVALSSAPLRSMSSGGGALTATSTPTNSVLSMLKNSDSEADDLFASIVERMHAAEAKLNKMIEEVTPSFERYNMEHEVCLNLLSKIKEDEKRLSEKCADFEKQYPKKNVAKISSSNTTRRTLKF